MFRAGRTSILHGIMSLLTLAGALLAISAAPVEVNVNAKTGETITGERAFRVTVSAKNPVTKVEFYVGSDLRDSDSSTPYEFRVDTLAETDGDLKIRFVAYTTAGEKGEKTITLKVDNGLSKGVEFHVEHANTLLSDGKYAEALVAGRIALQIDPKNVPAHIALARANIGLNKFDSAQKFAEDALAISPDDAGA
ncbi:tetratricopeptide repeat protein, partial [bacterium]